MMVKGREIDLVPYYACPYCGHDGNPLTQLSWLGGDPKMPGLLLSDGVLSVTLRADEKHYDLPRSDVLLIREVGRVPCRQLAKRRVSIDHVFFDWRWKSIDPTVPYP